MLRTCVAAAGIDSSVAVFLEPIALYHRRDLHQASDGGWLATDRGGSVAIGSARLYPAGADTGPSADAVLTSKDSGRRGADHDHLRQRCADEPAGGIDLVRAA